MSLAISTLGSCCCFSAFSASCACNSWCPLSSLSLEGHRTVGSEQLHLLSCIAPSGGCLWAAVTWCDKREKPILLRDQKNTEAMEISKRHFKVLFLSGASGNTRSCWLGRPAYLRASQVVYHGHGLGYIVCYVKRSKHDKWLTFSCCLGWGRGWAIDSCLSVSHIGIQSHHSTYIQLILWRMVL